MRVQEGVKKRGKKVICSCLREPHRVVEAALHVKKQPFFVRVSGRLKIAQRFIAGIVKMQGTQSVKRMVEYRDFCRYLQPSASRTTTHSAPLSQQ
jgi:hypothetical protein